MEMDKPKRGRSGCDPGGDTWAVPKSCSNLPHFQESAGDFIAPWNLFLAGKAPVTPPEHPATPQTLHTSAKCFTPRDSLTLGTNWGQCHCAVPCGNTLIPLISPPLPRSDFARCQGWPGRFLGGKNKQSSWISGEEGAPGRAQCHQQFHTAENVSAGLGWGGMGWKWPKIRPGTA